LFSCKTHVLRAFPNVWSSLFTVKIAAQGTFVSFSITTLQRQNKRPLTSCIVIIFLPIVPLFQDQNSTITALICSGQTRT